MSKWSNRHDFADDLNTIGYGNLKNGKIFLKNGEECIEIKHHSDCVPYYPYRVLKLIKDDDGESFYLADKSWIDMEEEKCGDIEQCQKLRKALDREYKRLRKKEESESP